MSDFKASKQQLFDLYNKKKKEELKPQVLSRDMSFSRLKKFMIAIKESNKTAYEKLLKKDLEKDSFSETNISISEPKGYCPQAKYNDSQGPLTIVTYQFTYSATDVFGNTAPAVNFTVTLAIITPPIFF